MPFYDAMTATIATLDADQLWDAVVSIGSQKLVLRQGKRWEGAMDEFRRLNRRIDDLQREEEIRRLRR
jgi:hypothetical protein